VDPTARRFIVDWCVGNFSAPIENFMTRSNLLTTVAWSMCISPFFLEFGRQTPAGWALWLVAALVPPLVYSALSGGPPVTIAEVLYRTENQ